MKGIITITINCLLLLPALIAQEPLFSLLPSSSTNITFSNSIIENDKINILTYEYFHNGGGVAVGDLNNDGLEDLYFTGNLTSNKLYLNQGNLQFEDITETSGTGGTPGWNTGVTMVDINNDGWLDIYVCLSGNLPPQFRANQLYVNNQDGTFTERAAEYGVDDTGYATQAAFFDFDLDGDLDLFILNHNINPINNFKPSEVRSTYEPNVGDKLYENIGGKFVNVSLIADLYSNPLGYGLGVSIGDLNQDGYPDIYVANDFIEHDYCYINQGDGTFKDVLKTAFTQTSQFSMGTDIADFNNDGLMDIFSVDMVAEDNYRQKTTMRPMSRANFYAAVEDGFHYQYMHNALQLNRGEEHFSNISKLAGVSNTDWSWAPLFIDLDLDGWKDLLITNGYKRDISNKDYVNFEKKKLKEFQAGTITNAELFKALLEGAPVTKIENYVFRNKGDYTFDKMNQAWNFEQQAFSNGAAYGDLDNDGDLDLVINNIDDEAYLFQNNAREQQLGNFLKLKLAGPAENPFGIGATIEIKTSMGNQYYENYLSRGFQSSVTPIPTIGLGAATQVDQVLVRWPDGKQTLVQDVKANQQIVINYQDEKSIEKARNSSQKLFEDITLETGLEVKHTENQYDDFKHELLLPHKLSELGPAMAVGDVNGDQLSDFYLGGATGTAGQLFLQQVNGQFQLSAETPFNLHASSEDSGATFFDADQDGDLDLYVLSGSNEYEAGSIQYLDRLYLNNGKGQFFYSKEALPSNTVSGSIVRPFDFDGDGDLDLFVGGRMLPRAYPSPVSSQLLLNEGGRFKDVSQQIAPDLTDIGMVTDAIWCDYDGDGDGDLILSGEWMPITILKNEANIFSKLTESGLESEVGWWFSLATADFDGDGDQDFIAGNLGTNYKYKASSTEPFQIYLNDFDENGQSDIVLGYFEEGELYPVRGRQCSSEQMPFIAKKFETYDLFAKAELSEIYGEAPLKKALFYEANNFQSSYIKNLGNGKFKLASLPVEAQFSAINSIVIEDFNADQKLDVLIAGNLFASEVETPRNDAGVGLLLVGDGQGNFKPLAPINSGIYLPYDVRQLSILNIAKRGKSIIAASNNELLKIFSLRNEK